MKPLLSRGFVASVFTLATVIIISGITLIYCSEFNTTAGVTNSGNSTEVEVDASKKKIKIKTTIPGIVVLFLGVIVLISLINKVSVRQVVPQERKPGALYSTLEFMQTKLSKHEERIPILLWWFIRNRGIAVRVDKKK